MLDYIDLTAERICSNIHRLLRARRTRAFAVQECRLHPSLTTMTETCLCGPHWTILPGS
jgi:hypothetical protein